MLCVKRFGNKEDRFNLYAEDRCGIRRAIIVRADIDEIKKRVRGCTDISFEKGISGIYVHEIVGSAFIS